MFSQFGEIVWQRLFNIGRILQTTALKALKLKQIDILFPWPIVNVTRIDYSEFFRKPRIVRAESCRSVSITMITVYHRRRPFFQRQGIVNTRGPFLESSGNLSTPKSNIEIKS